MKNETLCKILAHSICCVIMSHMELGIELVFWGEQAATVPAESVQSGAATMAKSMDPVAMDQQPTMPRYCQYHRRLTRSVQPKGDTHASLVPRA